jgi:hypothetical protein
VVIVLGIPDAAAQEEAAVAVGGHD